jgi:hypothetical protein
MGLASSFFIPRSEHQVECVHVALLELELVYRRDDTAYVASWSLVTSLMLG